MKTDIKNIDYIEKRNLKYAGTYDDASRELFGRLSLESGNITDAVDVFAVMNNIAELEKILENTISAGDYFHYKYICRLVKREMIRDEIALVIENAKKNGLSRYSAEAQKYLDNLNQAEDDEDENKKVKDIPSSKKKRQ